MERFMYAVTWGFAIMHNKYFGQKGHVFHRPFGNAPKMKDKKIISNLIYIANNPVEKKAVEAAWDYRWNFLRYAPRLDAATGRLEWPASSRHPFSAEYDPLEASKDMLYLVKAVRLRAAAGKVIDYEFFRSQRYLSLCKEEQQQLIDIIITTYNVIDYEPILRKYGSMESYCRVLRDVEGTDYDMDDDCEQEDYRHYLRMIAIAAEEGYDMRVRRYAGVEGMECGAGQARGPLMPAELAERLIRRFRREVGASNLEIRKLLKIKNY